MDLKKKQPTAAIKPVTLKRILLEYSDGTVLLVPETKTLAVGTAFMQTINQQQLEWQVLKKETKGLVQKLLGFLYL